VTGSGRPPRTCVFCGTSGLTLEHAWPRWIAGELGDGPWNFAQTFEDGDRSWATSTLDVKVRRVCASCNNGWMANLEARAKPLLVHMMNGEARELDADEQELLALWAAKTAMMLGFIHPERRSIAPEQYQLLHRSQRPPEGTKVWLARCASTWTVFYRHNKITLTGEVSGTQVEAYSSTFAVKSLVLQVFGYQGRRAVTTNPSGDATPYVTQVWPIERSPVPWPPGAAPFNDDGLRSLADAFVQAVPDGGQL
jgi:hypothetical protein